MEHVHYPNSQNITCVCCTEYILSCHHQWYHFSLATAYSKCCTTAFIQIECMLVPQSQLYWSLQQGEHGTHHETFTGELLDVLSCAAGTFFLLCGEMRPLVGPMYNPTSPNGLESLRGFCKPQEHDNAPCLVLRNWGLRNLVYLSVCSRNNNHHPNVPSYTSCTNKMKLVNET